MEQVKVESAEYGNIVDVTMLTCGTKAMVTYDSESTAQSAVSELNGKTVAGSTVGAELLSQPVSDEGRRGKAKLVLFKSKLQKLKSPFSLNYKPPIWNKKVLI